MPKSNIQIGRCSSCKHNACPKLKARQLYPELGCADWTNGVPIDWDQVEVITVDKVKD